MYCYTSSDIVKVFNYIKCLVMLLGEHIYFDSEDYFFLEKEIQKNVGGAGSFLLFMAVHFV